MLACKKHQRSDHQGLACWEHRRRSITGVRPYTSYPLESTRVRVPRKTAQRYQYEVSLKSLQHSINPQPPATTRKAMDMSRMWRSTTQGWLCSLSSILMTNLVTVLLAIRFAILPEQTEASPTDTRQ